MGQRVVAGAFGALALAVAITCGILTGFGWVVYKGPDWPSGRHTYIHVTAISWTIELGIFGCGFFLTLFSCCGKRSRAAVYDTFCFYFLIGVLGNIFAIVWIIWGLIVLF